MSLINKMLRDLDQRQAPAMDRSGLPSHVHPLPPERSGLPLWIVPALAAAAAGAWYFFGGAGGRSEVPPSAPVAAMPALPPPPAVAVAPTPASEAPSPKMAPPAVASARARSEAAAGLDTLKLETKLPSVRDKHAAEQAAARRAAPPTVAAAMPARPEQAVREQPPSTDQTAIDKHPRASPANDAAESEYRKGMSAVRRGAVAEAVEKLRAALQLDGRHVSARQALLSLLVEQQQWSEAQSLIEEGLALDPAQTGWAMALARLQLENGKLAEAGETLSRHAKYAEQNADYLAFQALLLQKLKRSREAAERYRAALALKPAESRWWYGLGLSLESEHKPQEAREAFLKARETGNLPPELATAVEQRLR